MHPNMMIDINLLLSVFRAPGQGIWKWSVGTQWILCQHILITFFYYVFQFSASDKLSFINDEKEVIVQNKGNRKKNLRGFLGISYQL